MINKNSLGQLKKILYFIYFKSQSPLTCYILKRKKFNAIKKSGKQILYSLIEIIFAHIVNTTRALVVEH